MREWGRQAVKVAGLTLVAVLVATAAWQGVRYALAQITFSVGSTGPGFTSAYAYFELQPDMYRSEALALVGEPNHGRVYFPAPTSDYPDPDLVGPPAGSTCDYWGEAEAMQDAGSFRLCFLGDRLVQRASYDVEEAHLIVVWSGRPWQPYSVLPA